MNGPTSTILITGGSRGIGRAVVERLLAERPDLHLVLLVRDLDVPGLPDRLAAATGSRHVSTVACDLSSLAQLRAAADLVGRQLDAGELPPLRGFLGSAAVQLRSRAERTPDGLERTFAVNVLANYLLVRLLMTRWQVPSRLVLVGCGVHFGDLRHNVGVFHGPRWEPVDRLALPASGPGQASTIAGQTAFSTSKLAVVYLVHALARRLPPGVDAYTYDPGHVPGTGLARDDTSMLRVLARGVGRGLTRTSLAATPQEAGEGVVAALTGPRPADSGAYLDRGTAVRSSADSYDDVREEELWTAAARLVGLPPEDPRAGSVTTS